MTNTHSNNAEQQRLQDDHERKAYWRRWGPYLSERQWGTVREDYSPDGSCWDYFPHDHARSRAYRWGEDGLLGITDRKCRLCFAIALWNGKDPILKERLFGLTGPEGNHGEDVKECYFYLGSTPTHSYMRALYKYPQNEFPYSKLLSENKHRDRNLTEYELMDTGIFDDNRYFDVFIEYAKNEPNDILIRLEIWNRGPDKAALHILPTLWCRNTWSWGRTGEAYTTKPLIKLIDQNKIICEHEDLGKYYFSSDNHPSCSTSATIFTENETNTERLFGTKNNSPYVKDGFHQYVIHGHKNAVSFDGPGTKSSFYSLTEIEAGQKITLQYRLCSAANNPTAYFGKEYDEVFRKRKEEYEIFYRNCNPPSITEDEELVIKQAYAGLLWSKQFYYYSVDEWHDGDPSQPKPAPGRKKIRNTEWSHLYNFDIISMPDKWEYPWYAAWDLAFHMLSFARIDPDFAKEQLLLFLREWYMHPNGQIPAYEFAFSDVNPPVHAWACWRVYKISGTKDKRDRVFLEKAFHKLLLNFTWWVNRKDLSGKNLFSGGFLGLDNIGIFDRSRPVPGGGTLEQADGTAWMAFYCSIMLSMSLELASQDPVYEDIASKFFEHFVAIVDAMNTLGGSGLWDDEDGFYYDQIYFGDSALKLKTRSLVGIIPLIAVEVFEKDVIDKLPGFKKRLAWFLNNRLDLAQHVSFSSGSSDGKHLHGLLAIASRERLTKILKRVLDETEFLSPFGLRSLSKAHEKSPFKLKIANEDFGVQYDPGESHTSLFGGNSNWRGPVWFPINYLLIEALERFHHFYGDLLKLECPNGSGNMLNLKQIADEICRRMTLLFVKDSSGKRPCHGEDKRYVEDPYWKDLVLFYEYFHGDTGRGLGASHQTGWTALVTRCLEKILWAREKS
jgi:Glycosyl hydrolase family 63 C-terminal domain